LRRGKGVLPGDPLAQDVSFGLLSLGATSVAGEGSVNMEISYSMICQNARACEQKGRMIAQFPVYGSLDREPPSLPLKVRYDLKMTLP